MPILHQRCSSILSQPDVLPELLLERWRGTSANSSEPRLSPRASRSVTIPSQSSHPDPQVHTGFISSTPPSAPEETGQRNFHHVLDTVPYTVSQVLARMCGSQTMSSNVLIFPFSSQETRPSSWLATRRGGSSAGQLMGRSTRMLKALALKLGVSGPAAAGCWHPGDVSPAPYTQSKLFGGLSSHSSQGHLTICTAYTKHL